MAKKKLNMKVVIIMAVMVLGFCSVGVLAYLKLHKNPHKLLAKAEVALKEKNYEEAGKFLGGAYGAAKEDEFKIELLFRLAEYHLIDSTDVDYESPEYHEVDWRKAIACWQQVSNLDTRHIKARRLLLGYFYETGLNMYKIGRSGVRVWGQVEDNALELLEVLEEKGMDRDPYILKAKALATLQVAKTGQTDDRAGSLAEAIGELEDLLEITPEDVDLYRYMSEAAIIEGEIGEAEGDLYAIERGNEKADVFLEKAIEASGHNAEAYKNFYGRRIASAVGDLEKINEVKGELEALAEKFNSSAEIHSLLARVNGLRVGYFDEAIAAISRAMELDPEKVEYALIASNSYYLRGLSRKEQRWIKDAIKIAKNALDLPDAQLNQGPRSILTSNYRYMLLSDLAKCYIELALMATEDGDTQANQQWTSEAEDTVESIKQLMGTEENVYVSMWFGMLEMARGNENEAIRKMYAAYEQMKTEQKSNMQLSYLLSRIFRDRPEIGVRIEFLGSAIRDGILVYDPELILEYSEMLLQMRRWTHVFPVVDSYESTYLINDRSQSIRTMAYIGAGQLDEAEEEVAKLDPDGADAIELRILLVQARLKRMLSQKAKQTSTTEKTAIESASDTRSYNNAEIIKYRNQQNSLYEKLLDIAPERTGSPVTVCNEYVQAGNIDRAKLLADRYISHFPEDINVQIYRQVLSEPEPKEVSDERVMEIKEAIINSIDDEIRKALLLGFHYQSLGAVEEAQAEFEKVRAIDPVNKEAVVTLFDIAMTRDDMKLAGELLEVIRSENLDQCEGNVFAARLDIDAEDYQNALRRLNEAIELRPIFPYLYQLRSSVHSALKDYDSAISDAKTARSQNPLDWKAVRQLAVLLYNRNVRLGKNVSPEHIRETENIIMATIYLNPNARDIRSLYAEVIRDREPRKAIAIWQQLQETSPTVANSLLLGNVALDMSSTETDEEYKSFLLDLAGSAYQKAYKLDPENDQVINAYSEYLRTTGAQAKMLELFGGKPDVLWRYYLRDGQYEKSKEVLSGLYSEDPSDTTVVRGLAIVASRTDNTEDIKKYSEEIMALDRTISNELWQIRMYLDAGLTQEAELKLASFRERNPDDPRAMLLDAWVAVSNGQLKRGLELTNRNLELDSGNAQAWKLRGKINSLLGDADQAVEDLQNSKKISNSIAIQIELAQALYRAGRTTEAIGELVSILQNEQAPERVRRILEGLYIESGRKGDLRKFYSQVLEKYPDNGYWINRTGLFYKSEGDYEQAEQMLKKAFELSLEDEGDPYILDAYLEVLWKQKKYQQLLKYASKHVSGLTAPVSYAQIAQTYATMGSKSNAVNYYLKAIEVSGTNQEFIFGILTNMKALVGPGVVAKWCNDKLKANPDSEVANLTMYNVSLQSRQYNKAVEYIDKCINVVDQDKQQWTGYVLKKASTLTTLYKMTSDRDYLSKSIATYQSILKKYPDNANVLNNLAYLLSDNDEQLELAAEYASQAHEILPNSPDLMDTYAYTLCKIGEYAKAEETLQMAIQVFERNSVVISWDVYMHLGMAQEGLEQQFEAAESYRRALKTAGMKISKINKNELNEAIERVLE